MCYTESMQPIPKHPNKAKLMCTRYGVIPKPKIRKRKKR